MTAKIDIHEDDEGLRLLKLEQVLDLVPVSKSSLYRDIRSGLFPQPIKHGRSSLWSNAEVSKWLAKRLAEREHIPSTFAEVVAPVPSRERNDDDLI